MSGNQEKIEALCRRYLAAMESGDLAALLANFTDDATATSPIFGEQTVQEFYSYVMRVTSGRRGGRRDRATSLTIMSSVSSVSCRVRSAPGESS